jgi:hypothetical protein
LIVLIVIFCLVQLAKAITVTGVQVSRASALTPEITPVCQPTPGVTFKVQKTGRYAAELIATGLQPGEHPYVYYGILDGALGAGFTGTPVNEKEEFFADLNEQDYHVEYLKAPEWTDQRHFLHLPTGQCYLELLNKATDFFIEEVYTTAYLRLCDYRVATSHSGCDNRVA